jgi:hypothetical protein
MKRLLNRIAEKCLNIFSKTIHIYLDTGQVVFQSSGESLRVNPLIYVRYESEKFNILGIGDESVPELPNYKIEVFNFRNVRAKTSLDPEQCLTAFFSHAFRKLMGSKVFVRPNIKVYNIDRLTAIFPENKEEYLERVLIASGAGKCEFL